MKKQFLSIMLCFGFLIANSQNSIIPEEAVNHIGKTMTVCGKVFGGRYLESTATKPTLLNMGGDFPNHFLTVLIREEDRKNFSFKPEERYYNKNICVTGKLIDYKGKPEIIVSTPAEITLQDETGSLETRTPIKEKLVKADKTAPLERTPVVEKSVPKKEVAAPSIAAVSEAGSYSIEVTSEVNLREGPSTDDKVLAVVKAGSTVKIYKSGNGWSYVSVKADDQAAPVYGFIKNSVLK